MIWKRTVEQIYQSTTDAISTFFKLKSMDITFKILQFRLRVTNRKGSLEGFQVASATTSALDDLANGTSKGSFDQGVYERARAAMKTSGPVA